MQRAESALPEFKEATFQIPHTRPRFRRTNRFFIISARSINQYDQWDYLRNDVWTQALERVKGIDDYNSWV